MIDDTKIALDVRRCRRCGEVKPFADFHKDRTSLTGFSSRCRPCVSLMTAAWAKRNRAKKNATDREWKRRNRHKDRARAVVRKALREKKIEKAKRCACCGRDVRLEAHHPDYAKPDFVIWLCKPCHAGHHAWGRKPRHV
jgi:ribosomal protein S27AE